MLVANSFDLWQKDSFFSAAEEVQQSADIMESAYRMWLKERAAGVTPKYLNELCRELQMALSTAKWQLEEFERAVRMSYKYRADETTMTRHRQFISAMDDQISRVEGALRESSNMDNKQPLGWVNLDKEERDELAMFLSGNSAMSGVKKVQHVNLELSTNSPAKKENKGKAFNHDDIFVSKNDINSRVNAFEDVQTCSVDANCVPETEVRVITPTKDDISCETESTFSSRRKLNSTGSDALEIVIDDKYGQKESPPSDKDAKPKDNRLEPFLSRSRCDDYPQTERGIVNYARLRRFSLTSQLSRWAAGGPRQLQTPIALPISRAIRLTLVLMLTVFLVVPFLFYST